MNDAHPAHELVARRISIQGVVQGVGFRPFVYQLAAQHHVRGWVLNGEAGVEIHAEGAAAALASFLTQLQATPPAAACIRQTNIRTVAPEGFADFQIRPSHRHQAPTTGIAPDLSICAECTRELSDPTDRRYHYPYLNCAHCGPRYSLIEGLPYDRARTTMQAWPLCQKCQQDYDNPGDRRHHAQPVACADCGPGYSLIEEDRCLDQSDRAIHRAAELLRQGKIVALKGLGGYHLACDACNSAAVTELRKRKFRKARPFALLACDLTEVRRYVMLTGLHEYWLQHVARPIVIAPARIELTAISPAISPDVSPGNGSLGVMLPSSPLHLLLFAAGAPSPLVLTSGNRASEPIPFRDDDAIDQLEGLADALLIGQRPIARRVDDSVITVRGNRPLMIRRGRGFAPAAVCQLPATQPILALGSDLKNAIALVVDGQVLVSQHLGDLDDLETERSFVETVHDLLDMYQVPREDLIVVHDLHPQFRSTHFAGRFPLAQRRGIQHHHAHLASVLAEHQLLDERVVGVAFDGMGYGTDGTIWGGEFFVGSVRQGFTRCGSLRPVRIPGGDAAAKFPAQAAAGFLAELDNLPEMQAAPFFFPQRYTDAVQLVKKNVRCYTSTSVGRLFDAVAALVGFVGEMSFEGQAAIWLENLARPATPQCPYPFPHLDPRPLLQALISDRIAGRPIAEMAAAFHAALALATVDQVRKFCVENKTKTVVFSGGVFQNELLLEAITEGLGLVPGIRLLMNQLVPANDGGICVGQAALVSASLPGSQH